MSAPDRVSSSRSQRRWIAWLIGGALGLFATLVVVASQEEVGIARDEVVYLQNGARYASWWIGLVTLRHGIDERSVTQTFGGPGASDNNREHPPLMKTLFGLSERLLHRDLGLVDEVTAFRLPSAIAHGVLVALVYALVLALWGQAEAILAALLVVGLPRAVFHAGLACFDAPTMTLWFATVVAYWRCLDGRRWPWQAGVVWGLALATKHTALLLPFALGVHHAIIGVTAARRASRSGTASGTASVTASVTASATASATASVTASVTASGGARRMLALARAAVAYRWRVIVSLAVLGPLTLFVLWPWLWFDPVHHVRDWLAFHTGHVHYNYEYLGRNWNAPRFPWHVALVTTLFTVPTATLAAAAVGAGVWIARRARRRAPDAATPADETPEAGPRANAPVALLVLSAAASIGPFFLGTTPIFGAEKHWMPVLPTICIAAAVGAVWAARRAATVCRLSERAAVFVVAGSILIAAAAELSVAEPYALTWYSALAGGAPGGADLGMNRQFWGVAVRGVLPELAAEAAPTGTTYIYTHDASPAWGLYQQQGLIPRTLIDAGWEQAGIEHSQLAIVLHELHFNRHDYLIWRSYGTVQPSFVLRTAGVPIVSVYRRPGRP
ncbi:MAG TPA: glycosyltransferase family 39 protein [Kofleriaceae bacterium]|nr:glycosyltransferase family 39 protein [Kofleriaceae bacterium]